MQNRLDVHNLEKAISLGRWCSDNLEEDAWTIELLSMVPAHYKFEFRDPYMTTVAALSS